MYFQNLRNIKEVKQLLKEQEISDFEIYLSELYPNDIISIDATAFHLNLSIDLVKEVLMYLAKYRYLNTRFIVRCNNSDFDLVHTFAFDEYKSLIKFVSDNSNKCPDCFKEILEENTEVLLIIPDSNIKEVNSNE